MATRWTQAATILQPTIEVCGRRLLPFCLRHRIALQAIDSPILATDREFGAMDVIKAVRVLQTHDLDEVRRPLSFMDGYHLRRMRFSKRLLKTEAYKLMIYFNSQSLWPRFWQKDEQSSKGDDNGFPWELSVVASLVRNGHTTEEAWTMPEAAAIWLHMAHARAAGSNIQIVSDAEWEAMENYKLQKGAA